MSEDDDGAVESTESTTFTLTVLADCASPANFAGVWTGTFSCTNSCGPDGFGGEIELTITQNGDAVSFTDSLGGSFNGTVCGGTLAFSSDDPAVVETGTLTLTSGDQATKQSHYRASDPVCEGDCMDTLTREEPRS